ncbi:MAG TPA: hypothetical protein VN764_15545, partial [Polyangiaceae bacterium]|nr:hypothetical protein [Polyangiaceae bacterium]
LDTRKAGLYLILILGFVLGGSWGAYAFQHVQFIALAFPAAAALCLALVYWAYSRRQGRPRR